jgi:hypothetical protein
LCGDEGGDGDIYMKDEFLKIIEMGWDGVWSSNAG